MANRHPLYANRWYRQLTSTQLRQEIQNLYQLVEIEDDAVAPPVGEPPVSVEWDFGTFAVPAGPDVDFGSFVLPLALNANFGGY